MTHRLHHVAGTVPVPFATHYLPRRATARVACLLQNRVRAGLTLVELLVVIVILLILTTVALPILAPNTEGRRLREASRLVSSYVASARNRAIETGRPAGVQFERMTNNLNACMVLHTVEVPPPYSGDTLGATCVVRLHNNPLQVLYGQRHVVLHLSMGSGSCDNTMIRVNDLVKLNHQGRTYRVIGPDADNDGIIDTPSGTDPVLVFVALPLAAGETPATYFPWVQYDNTQSPEWFGAAPAAVPYQFIRQPVKSAIPPLQLPEGAVVDLYCSGEGSTGALKWIPAGTANVPHPTMIFEPAGTIGSVFHFDFDPSVSTQTAPDYRPPSAPLHFLMGRSEGCGREDASFPDPEKNPWNIRDPRNLWVSVGSQSGLLSTAENSVVPANPTITTGDTPPVGPARAIAVQMQSMGGR